jgi:hypothetical protein
VIGNEYAREFAIWAAIVTASTICAPMKRRAITLQFFVAFVANAVLVACQPSRSDVYDKSEIDIVSIGWGDSVAKVRFRIVPDHDQLCPGVQVVDGGEHVGVRFLRGRGDPSVPVDCPVETGADGVSFVSVPYDRSKPAELYIRDRSGEQFLAGCSPISTTSDR